MSATRPCLRRSRTMASIRHYYPILALVCIFLYASAAYADAPKSIKSSDGVRMMLIPGGTYDMGSHEEDLIEKAPIHRVYVADFYMDEHAVTNKQFARFLNDVKPGEGPADKRKKWVVLRSDLEQKERSGWWPTEITHENGKYVAYKGYKDHPVITVSWVAAMEYCDWAGKRLPSEAEWEKAARGGLKGMRYAWGNEIPTEEIVHTRLWKSPRTAAPIGPAISGKPNGYGLYNMSGGVWEWCYDWYAPNAYAISKRTNPLGPSTGEVKVLRGGSWFNSPTGLRVALRNFLYPLALDETTGFRCASALTTTPDTKKEK